MEKDLLQHPLVVGRRKDLEENIERIQRANFKEDRFCLMPFVNIILEPNGSVGLCRHKGTEHSLGNLKNQTWKEIWNGDQAKAWRTEFLEGKPQTCTAELTHQKCNLCPQLGKMFPNDPSQLKAEMSPPVRLTANFNGQCNLRCIMCDVWELPNGFYTEENFWSPARTDLFPYLKEIDMLSGEPFIQADTFKLIDEVSSLNPDCLWSITTNAHWTFNKRIKEGVDKIKIKNLILSVDSFNKETYNKIRTPGNLEVVLKNIEILREYEKERIQNGQTPLHMNLNFVVQRDNWQEINEVLHYCLDRNIHPFLTFCYRPNELSLLSLSEAERKQILETYLQTMKWDEICLAHRVFSPLIDSFPPLDKAYFLDKMKGKKDLYLQQQG